MKRMTIALMCMLTVLTVSAQVKSEMRRDERNGGKGECKKERKMDAEAMALRKASFLKEKLDLDKKQYNEVFKVYLENGKQLEAKAMKAKAEGAELQRADKEAMSEMRIATDKKLQKILSEVQYAEYKQLAAHRVHDGKRGHGEAKRGHEEAKRGHDEGGGNMHRGERR